MRKRTKSQENSMLLDPNRERIAKNMSVVPGGPHNNSPIPVEQSQGTPTKAQSIYFDYAQDYNQMGTMAVDPNGVKPSGLQQNFPVAARGLNRTPYNMQAQPDVSANAPVTDMMESNRLVNEVQKGLPTGPMGYQGLPAGVPGSPPGNMMGTSGPPLMQGSASIVPGSTPQKIGQKKKGGKK